MSEILFCKLWTRRLFIFVSALYLCFLLLLIYSLTLKLQFSSIVLLALVMVLTTLLTSQTILRKRSESITSLDIEYLSELRRATESFLKNDTAKVDIDTNDSSQFNVIANCIQTLYQRQLNSEGQVQELSIQLQEKTDQLKAQQKMDHDRNQNLHKMFAGASHDLRQPLQAMVIFISAIQEFANERQAPLLQKLEQVVENLNHMFTDLLDISKLESRMKRIPKKNVAIKPLLEKIYDEFEALAHDKRIEFRLYNRDLSVYSNPNMLERIIRNMISNAIRYTRTGGVLIGCRTRDDEVWIEVWDTGRGIPQDKMDVIFDEFVQIHEPGGVDSGNKGVGLGLFIVKRLAQLLDHSIIARSKLHRGTLFRIVVPVQPMYPHSEFPQKNALLVPTIKLSSPTLNIALIDDDNVVRQYLGELLHLWGMKVQVFESLADLENLAPAKTTPLDFIISDFQLGVHDTGLQAIELIRTQQQRKVPAVIITGTNDEALLKLIGDSAIPCLKKPVKPAKLRALINMLGTLT